MSTREKLNRLARLRAKHAEIVKPFLDEMLKATAKYDRSIEALEKEIKNDCLDEKQTIEGDTLQVVYFKGRVTLDADYIGKNYPHVYHEASKVGEPYATISVKKTKTEKIAQAVSKAAAVSR